MSELVDRAIVGLAALRESAASWSPLVSWFQRPISAEDARLEAGNLRRNAGLSSKSSGAPLP